MVDAVSSRIEVEKAAESLKEDTFLKESLLVVTIYHKINY